MNFIKNFWNGNVPLVISYWVIGVIVNVIVSFAIGFIVTFLLIILGAPNTSINIVLHLCLIAWVIFLTVGIWRSSDKYPGKKIWPIITKIVLIIGIIYFAVDTIINPNLI